MAILGIDEVGRGPWAGPLVMGAVILRSPAQLSEDSDFPEWVSALTDSKKLTEKKRTELATQINNLAAATALGWVSASEIDQIGLSQALRLAARRAILKIQRQKVPFSEIIIDGTVNFLSDTPLTHYVTTLKKADALIKEVSAASIIAKVARDDYMHKLFTAYPDYGFERHVGYGTAAHRKALQDFGPSPSIVSAFVQSLRFRPISLTMLRGLARHARQPPRHRQIRPRPRPSRRINLQILLPLKQSALTPKKQLKNI